MKAIPIVVLMASFFIPSGPALAEASDPGSPCPIAKTVLSGSWKKLEPGLVENDRGRRYMETRKSASQQLAMLILTNEAHGWSVEYQDEDHGSIVIRKRLPLKTKEQVEACAQFFTDPNAGKEILDVE